jgi:hypothetical protein
VKERQNVCVKSDLWWRVVFFSLFEVNILFDRYIDRRFNDVWNRWQAATYEILYDKKEYSIDKSSLIESSKFL